MRETEKNPLHRGSVKVGYADPAACIDFLGLFVQYCQLPFHGITILSNI